MWPVPSNHSGLSNVRGHLLYFVVTIFHRTPISPNFIIKPNGGCKFIFNFVKSYINNHNIIEIENFENWCCQIFSISENFAVWIHINLWVKVSRTFFWILKKIITWPHRMKLRPACLWSFRENLYRSFAKYALLSGEFDLVECADFWLWFHWSKGSKNGNQQSNILISEKFIYDGTAIVSQYILGQ